MVNLYSAVCIICSFPFFIWFKACQFAKKGTLCAKPDPAVSPCLSAGRCDGQSGVCPGPLPISEVGRRCYEHGHCLNGVCMPFCSRLGLKTCICDDGICSNLDIVIANLLSKWLINSFPCAAGDSCLICCAFDIKLANGERRSMCQPIVAKTSFSLAGETTPLSNGSWKLFRLAFSSEIINKSSEEYFFATRGDVVLEKNYEIDLTKVVNMSELVTMHLENNRPCAIGFCRNGLCIESKTQSVGRLWPLFLSTSGWCKLIWELTLLIINLNAVFSWIVHEEIMVIAMILSCFSKTVLGQYRGCHFNADSDCLDSS